MPILVTHLPRPCMFPAVSTKEINLTLPTPYEPHYYCTAEPTPATSNAIPLLLFSQHPTPPSIPPLLPPTTSPPPPAPPPPVPLFFFLLLSAVYSFQYDLNAIAIFTPGQNFSIIQQILRPSANFADKRSDACCGANQLLQFF